MGTSGLEKTVLAELADAFSARGFKKRAGYKFTIEIGPDVIGRFAVTRSSPPPYESIVAMPLVGVRYEPSARLVDEVLGRQHALLTPTLQIGLFYLVPRLGPGDGLWEFGREPCSRRATVDDLMRCMDEAGIPFMQALNTPGAILKELEGRNPQDSQSRYEAAVLRWSIGERDLGASLLRALIDQGRSTEPGSQPDYFGGAAARTLELVGEHV